MVYAGLPVGVGLAAGVLVCDAFAGAEVVDGAGLDLFLMIC